jgi:hypothetical protein
VTAAERALALVQRGQQILADDGHDWTHHRSPVTYLPADGRYPEMGRCVLDHHGHADRGCDPDEVVDEGRIAERPDHRCGDDHAARAGGLGVAGELDRGADAGSADADEDGHGGSRFLEDEVGERSALVGRQLQHLAGEAEGNDAVGAALEREANDPPLRLEVDRVVVRERRADRRVHASPCVERRHP